MNLDSHKASVSTLAHFLVEVPHNRTPDSNFHIENAFKALNLFPDLVQKHGPSVLQLFSQKFWMVPMKPNEVLVSWGTSRSPR